MGSVIKLPLTSKSSLLPFECLSSVFGYPQSLLPFFNLKLSVNEPIKKGGENEKTYFVFCFFFYQL